MSDIITPVYGGLATITFTKGYHPKFKTKHIYTVDVPSKGIVELWQPGVTSIIGMLNKPFLIPWAIDEMVKRVQFLLDTDPSAVLSKDMFRAVMASAKETWRDNRDEAAVIGTYVHNFLEAELNYRSGFGASPSLPPDVPAHYRERVDNSISAGLRFFDQHKITIVQAESPRWSAEHGYIGTGDLIAWVDGELTALDYKTSKRLYSTVFLQLAAYQKAYEEEHPGQKITKRLGVNVGRDGVLNTEERDNMTLETDFQCFLSLLTLWRWDRENQGSYSKPAPMIVGPIN